jgi:hypothetical protein
VLPLTPLTPFTLAVIVVVPVATVFANPFTPMVATFTLDDFQVA